MAKFYELLIKYIGIPLLQKLGNSIIQYFARLKKKKENERKAKEYVESKDKDSSRDKFDSMP